MSDSISDLMKGAFDKILPIPKTPRVYRPPPPPKPVSWTPSGNLKNHIYRERLRDFASLCQRVDVSFQLEPLSVDEIAPYITHRLRAAGAAENAASIFSSDAASEVYRYAQGIPRLVNNVCDMALLVASGEGLQQVDAASVIKAAEDRSVPTSNFGL